MEEPHLNLLLAMKDMPVPTLLILAGVVFLLLALGAQLSAHIHIPETRQRSSAILGGALLGGGILLFLATVNPSNATTGTATTTAPQLVVWSATTPTLFPPPAPTSLPTATPSAPEGTPNDLLYEAQQWPLVPGSGFTTPDSWKTQGFTETTVPTMTMRLADQELQVDLTSGDTMARVALLDNAARISGGNAYMISIDVESQYQTGCEYGLVFGGNTNHEFYRFMIENADEKGNNDLWYFVDRVAHRGGPELHHTILIPKTSLSARDTPASMHIVAQGQHVFLYINGQYLDEIYTDSLPQNLVGVSVGLCPHRTTSFTMSHFEVRTHLGEKPPTPIALDRDDFSDDGDRLSSGSRRLEDQENPPYDARVPHLTTSNMVLHLSLYPTISTLDSVHPLAIRFRYHKKNYEQITISQNEVRFNHVQNGHEGLFLTQPIPAAQWDTFPPSYTLIVRDERISLFRNGKQVATFLDNDELDAGEVTFSGSVDFDDVIVLP